MQMRDLLIMGTMIASLPLIVTPGCGRGTKSAPPSKMTDVTNADQVVERLRHHCKACHAVGPLKFITSQSDAEVWENLFSSEAPSGKTWAEQIVVSLEWPSDEPPSTEERISDDRDFMPKGIKRYDLADDMIEDRSARKVILEALRDEIDAREGHGD